MGQDGNADEFGRTGSCIIDENDDEDEPEKERDQQQIAYEKLTERVRNDENSISEYYKKQLDQMEKMVDRSRRLSACDEKELINII